MNEFDSVGGEYTNNNCIEWVSEPPIVRVNLEEQKLRVKDELMRSINNWFGEDKDKGFKEKVEKATPVVNGLSDVDGGSFYVYKLNGRAEAVIDFEHYDEQNEIIISSLVAHPRTANAGTILIEFCLSCVPEDMRYDCRIQLIAMSDAVEFYKALGFSIIDKESLSMELSPSKSGCWYYDNNKWRVSRYRNITSKFVSFVPSLA